MTQGSTAVSVIISATLETKNKMSV